MEKDMNLWGVVEEAFDKGQEQVEKEIEKLMKPLIEDLQKSAKDLLQNAPELAKIGRDSSSAVKGRRNKLLQSLNNISPEDVINEVDKIYQEQIKQFKDTITLEKYTQKKFLFQHKLNLFIGQKIKTYYVYNSSSTDIVLTEIDSSNVITKDSFKGTMRYDRAKITPFAQEQALKVSSEELEKSRYLRETYKEIIYRANKFKEKSGKKSEIILLWKPQKRWKYMKIINSGDISESYAAFYLNDKFDIFTKANGLEGNINIFMEDKKYGIQSVDNISGLLQGDVNIGNVAYAIKSDRSTVFGDIDILNIAATLVSTSAENINQNLIKQFQINLQSIKANERNKQLLYKNLDTETQKIINQLKKDFNKRK